MEAEGGATDWRFWALVVAAVSLIWNVANTALTLWMASAARNRSTRLEELRGSVRDPIRDALATMERIGRRARALSDASCSVEQLREDAVALNREAVDGLGHLQDTLHQADTSILTRCNDWESRFEPKIDGILNRFNEANNPVHHEAKIRAALSQIHSDLRTLTASISSVINAEIIK